MEICPVCLNVKDLIFKFECETIKHGICNKCFTKLKLINSICPICRASEIKNNNHESFSAFRHIILLTESKYICNGRNINPSGIYWQDTIHHNTEH